MQEAIINVQGAVTFWRTAESEYEALKSALHAAGFGFLTPEVSTPKRSLKLAIREVCGQSGTTMIRPLEQSYGYTIVDEERHEWSNDYSNERSFVLDIDSGTLTMSPQDNPELMQSVAEAYVRNLSHVPPIALSNIMVKAVDAMNGVALRDRGGVYWLPQDSVRKWKQLAAAVEKASVKEDATTIYMMHTQADDECLRAVKDGIIHEMGIELEKITEAIDSGKLGKRALKSKEKAAVGLRDKLTGYETILGETLNTVRQSIEVAETRAAEAALVAASKND